MKNTIWIVLGLIVYWVILAWFGLPFPHPDDGALFGAALNIGQGGGLENTLMDMPEAAFLYPPFHAYFWGWYLRLAGTSAMTITILYVVLCVWISWNLLETCRAFGRQWVGWYLIAIVTVYLAAMGLRPDVTGLFWMSLALRLGVCESLKWRAWAPFAAMLSAATHPPMLAMAGPWLFYLMMRDRRILPWMVLSAVAVLGILYGMIGGQVELFLERFLGNAAGTGHEMRRAYMKEALKLPGLIKFIVLPSLLLTLMLVKSRRTCFDRYDVLVILAMALGFYVSTTSASSNRILPFVVIIGIALTVYRMDISECVAFRIVTVAVAMVVLIMARPLLNAMTTVKPIHAAQLASRPEVVQARHLMVDWWALRYVFDYKIRPGMYAFTWAGHSQDPVSGLYRKPPEECWVVSAMTVAYCKLNEPGLPVPRQLKIAGCTVGRWIVNAGEIGVVPAQVEAAR